MKLTTVEEMRNIDRRSIQETGIPEIVLMENAAREIFHGLEELTSGTDGKRICLIGGTGNNGGDAFAVARHVANAGGKPQVFVLGQISRMTASAKTNYDIIKNMGLEVFQLQEESDWNKLLAVLRRADAVVDGLLGTGFHGSLRPEAKRLIEMVNMTEVPVLAIDVPSGVDADNGRVTEVAIKAAMTVTLGAPKWGMLFAPGSRHCGRIITGDIGAPREILEDENIRQAAIMPEDVERYLLPRPDDAHKGSCGRILVIAGSRGMTGAAMLASKAALRIGAGIVTLACPASLNTIFEVNLTEVMTLPVEDKGSGAFGMANLAELLEVAKGYDQVLIGPGLGRSEDIQDFVREFVINVQPPVVVDADGIYAFRGQGEFLSTCNHRPILTPHLGEMATLLDISIAELKAHLLTYGRQAAREYNAIFVIKSETTVVIYPDGMAYVSQVGNSGMATAGSGDVLAGTIAGLYRLTAAEKVPLTGVYLHGRAGDIAYEAKGNCLIASDIIKKLPQAVNGFLHKI